MDVRFAKRAAAARGFTLLELMVASAIGLGVVATAFVALSAVQEVTARQAAADELVSGGRVALESMVREIRSAGDALELLPASCLGGAAHPAATALCPPLLDAHPWRILLARNAWVDANGDGSLYSRADTLPPADRAFSAEAANAIAFRFVPYENWAVPRQVRDGDGRTRRAVLGRIERVDNPLRFPAGAGEERVTVLLDNVLLDDRMRVNPLDPDETDATAALTLFSYRLLARSGELTGSPAITMRDTTLDDRFLTPPLRFFATATPPALSSLPPYATGGAAVEVVGLLDGGGIQAQLLATGNASMDPTIPDSDYRFVLDNERIRAVRIAFKVVDPRERPAIRDGIDLDGDPSNGTAAVHAFETTVELKVLAVKLGAR